MTENPEIKTEEKLLIGLCRFEFSDEDSYLVRNYLSGIADWKYFSDLANSHGIGAMVYHNLEKPGLLQHVPAGVAETLRNIMILSLTRNTYHVSEIKKVLNVLNNAGIKTVLLKGLALEIMAYGNKGLRQMTDVDILISRADCIKARKLLLANGFSSLPLKSALHNLIITYTGKHLPSLIKNEFSIDIHHELFGEKKRVLTRMLFENSYETELDGIKTYIPGAQLFFLYLIKHLNYHELNNESQLRLYADLVVLLEKFSREIITEELILLAEQAGISEALACKLELLRIFWGVSFPGWIDDFISKYKRADSAAKFLFFLKSPKNNPVMDKSVPYRNTLKEIPGIHRKAVFLLGDLFPSISFMKKRYNCRSSMKALLYYPHRLGKLWYLIK
jgi:Uncharacterised nucleotidyltransferase